MRMWPFRRKSKRKGSKHGQSSTLSMDTDAPHHANLQRDPGRPSSVKNPSSSGIARRPSRRDAKKLQRKSDRRTYSFSPHRGEYIHVRRLNQAPPVPAVPSQHKQQNGGDARRAVTMPTDAELEKLGAIPGQAPLPGPNSHQMWQRPPTLSKRSGPDLPRRKSSKRRKESHEREAELKALASMPIPNRAATEFGLAGRPMKKDSKKLRAGLNRYLENPSSDISLPSHDSLNSSRLSGSREDLSSSFKLTAVGVLSPHPTIRISENSRWTPPHGSWNDDPSDPRRRRRISDRLPEEVLKAAKRIDDLADDLDSGDLREIMERDQRRREKRKLKEQQKTERKLLRRMEKLKAEEEAAARNGTEPPQVMDRGVMGRELAGTPAGSVVDDDDKGKTAEAVIDEQNQADTIMLEKEELPRSPISPVEDSAAESEPVVETAKVARLSRIGLQSPPPSPSLKRRDSNPPRATPVPPPQTQQVPARPPSDASSRRSTSWTALLRRISKRKKETAQSPTPPPSTVPAFLNTSRDSVSVGQSAQPNPMSFMTYTTANKQTSGMPKRTRSKFREDLPELPISPPDSRVASPETEPIPIPLPRAPMTKRGSLVAFDSGVRDTPTSGHRSVERLRNETPTSDLRAGEAPSPDIPISQSMASIDSEGSWFSGRVSGSKRSSSQLQASLKRESGGSFARRFREFSESNEDLDIMDDEYLNNITPGVDIHRKSTGGALPSSDEEDDGVGSSGKLVWHGSFHKRPRIVHQERVKSRDGLKELMVEDEATLDDNDDNDNDKVEEVEFENGGIQRATSIDYGGKGHTRKISAGSARILDVKPRSSVDSRRKSNILVTDE